MKKFSIISGKPNLALPKIDLRAVVEDFRTLDPKDPGAWPLVPRIIILGGMFLIILAAAAWFGWQSQYEELGNKREEEGKLKDEWLAKKKQAVNLDVYRGQLVEIERSFGALLKQLPNAAEMESLLVDINQAGLGRGLQFELFKPGVEVVKDFYAELPITINLTGSYHDFGSFSGDIAKLPRIVTLNDINVVQGKTEGALTLATTAKTFRYLDEAEVAQRKKQEKDKAKGAKK
jgi:type IV pilus assembly protein PilO